MLTIFIFLLTSSSLFFSAPVSAEAGSKDQESKPSPQVSDLLPLFFSLLKSSTISQARALESVQQKYEELAAKLESVVASPTDDSQAKVSLFHSVSVLHPSNRLFSGYRFT